MSPAPAPQSVPHPPMPSPPAAREPVTPPLDLDAQIAAAELRVMERDARLLRHGHQLGERLSSRSTQARLALAGVAGVVAIVALARLARRPARAAAAPPGAARHAPTAPTPALQPLWLQWLPLALQLVTASSRPAAPPAPTPAGWMGWVGPLLAAGKSWAGRHPGRASRAASSGAPGSESAARRGARTPPR